MRRMALTWAVVLVAVTGCGTPGDRSGQPAGAGSAASPRSDAATYATCEEFSDVFDPRVENQLSYLPDEQWLLVSPSSITYKIDLVEDTRCIGANPALAGFVTRFRSEQQDGQRSECRGVLEQLGTGDPTGRGKDLDPGALRDYAVSICRPLGIAVPR